ncbi:MAG: hypothetical protein ACYTGS_10790, partial [Planctomycetota bacterium]
DATDPIDVQAPYLESDIFINYSDVFGETWPGAGNINAYPIFVDESNHNQGYSWISRNTHKLPEESPTENPARIP